MNLHTDHPYWLLKNGLMAAFPPVESDLKCDVLVMGAGISGAMAACRLVEEGLDVIVVDGREAVTGSTSASTCLLMYELDEPLVSLRKKRDPKTADAVYRTSYNALNHMEEWVERAGGAEFCSYRRKPSVYFASSKRHVAWMREEAEARQALGLDVRVMEPEEVSADFSFKAPLALVTEHAAEADSYRMTHGLLHYASRKGVRIFDRTWIDKIDDAKGGVTAVTGEKHKITARKIVFAAGYESQQYLKRHVANNVGTFALVSEPLEDLPGWWRHSHIWETARPYIYMRTTPEGRVIMGGEDEKFVSTRRRDAHLPAKTHKLEKRFRELFPDIPMRTAFAWAGTFAETPDSMPRIGRTPEWQHGYFSLGYGGNGITFSAIAAEIIAAEIAGRPKDYAPLFSFEAAP